MNFLRWMENKGSWKGMIVPEKIGNPELQETKPWNAGERDPGMMGTKAPE
jgi:hypothetical protein